MGRGHAVAIEDILKEIVSMSDKDIEVKVDEKKLRPVDVPIIEPDIEKIKRGRLGAGYRASSDS